MMIFSVCLLLQLCLLCLGYESLQQLKKLHHIQSIKYLDSTISLRLYENVNNDLQSSLELIRVEDIYEDDSKVAQAIHIVTYYYDLSDLKDGFLKPVDKKHNKAFASLMSSGSKPLKDYDKLDVVEGDHGLQDGINNKLYDPVVNVIARIVNNKLHIRGVMVDYREGLTGDDMLKDNFELEADIPQFAPVKVETSERNKTLFYILSAITIVIYLFVVNSDVYKR